MNPSIISVAFIDDVLKYVYYLSYINTLLTYATNSIDLF